MAYHVRRLGPDDHEQLRAVRLRALAGEPAAYGSTVEQALAMSAGEWRRRLDPAGHPHFGGFDGAGQLVGLVAGLGDPDDPGVVDVVSMWVDPPARGTGLAAALVQQVVAWAQARGSDTLRLVVTDGNARAEGLYRKLGFVRNGRSEVRERDGRIEVEMDRPLDPRPDLPLDLRPQRS